ncbi:recombinase family protein [Brevibacillus brevis]|uniref:Recombinase domain-containing protein n=1 Tax=Brevibacillus brevis TaxID=1393 RepID=A0A517I9G3_BREBE|nr:recombinase family protein [Brevibacillus brevis]QDS35521.1 hypothetical protein FPS98_16730 [Brevibacillus brevis]
MNYIRYWQSSGESERTSIRVSESHEQIAKKGVYSGGTAPYGYTYIKSGEVNKMGKELLKLVPYEKELVIVRDIFNMVYEWGYGSNRIAKHLNEKGAPTRHGGRWSTATINTMLRSPIYKGYMAYGKRSVKSGSSLMINREEWILPEKPNKNLIFGPENV